MAITIISTNQSTLSAGYNPLRWYLSSTNVNEKAFRFIVEVFAAGTATNLVIRDSETNAEINYEYWGELGFDEDDAEDETLEKDDEEEEEEET